MLNVTHEIKANSDYNIAFGKSRIGICIKTFLKNIYMLVFAECVTMYLHSFGQISTPIGKKYSIYKMYIARY